MQNMSKSVIRSKVTISANGRIVIPAKIRKALGITPGEMLTMDARDGVLRIESFDRQLERIQDEIIRLVGRERSLADELIAERHEEVRRELDGGGLGETDTGTEMRKAS
jgi:AbrB family looped-hinge helix DNA binding protein